jgi:hypothetical protein
LTTRGPHDIRRVMNVLRVIVPARRSRISAMACGAVAFLFVVGAVGFLLEPELSTLDRLTASALCASVALGVGALAWRLGRPRGGVLLDEGRDCIGLVLTSPRDVWWIEREACLGIYVSEPNLDHASDPGLYGVVLARHAEPPVVLVETPDPVLTQEAAESLQVGLGLVLLEQLPRWDELAESVPSTAWVRVSERVALHGVMIAMGISSLGVGGVLASKMASHPIVSIFIAPVAILTGLVLLTLPIIKRLATEELTRAEGVWRYRWRLYGFSWGERQVSAQESSWRLRVGDAGGARLELVTMDGEIWLGSGATSRSTASVADLSDFPSRYVKTNSNP